MLEPIGIDRWADELALKYGMRDSFTCPVGGRWLIAFWSKRDLSNVLTPASRILLQAASSFAAERLEHLAGPDVKRDRLARPSDAARARRAAPGLDGSAGERDRQSAGAGRGDGAQSHQEGTSEAGGSQSRPRCLRSATPEPDPLTPHGAHIDQTTVCHPPRPYESIYVMGVYVAVGSAYVSDTSQGTAAWQSLAVLCHFGGAVQRKGKQSCTMPEGTFQSQGRDGGNEQGNARVLALRHVALSRPPSAVNR